MSRKCSFAKTNFLLNFDENVYVLEVTDFKFWGYVLKIQFDKSNMLNQKKVNIMP